MPGREDTSVIVCTPVPAPLVLLPLPEPENRK
jgi:hypothetical protein